jgi:hypothetical protein
MKALPSLNDTEWSTYDVILLSSRLGARPNPLAKLETRHLLLLGHR